MSDNSVISTRVRLARNLKDFPFPCKLSPDGMEKVIEKSKIGCQKQQQLYCLRL